MGCIKSKCCCCSVCKEKDGDEYDRRNDYPCTQGTSHREQNTGDMAGRLLQNAETTGKNHRYKTFDSSADQTHCEVNKYLLKFQSMSNVEKQELLEKMILENEELKQKLNEARKEMKKKQDQTTENMAHIMVRENKGGFECPSDLLNPTKIAKKLTTLYEDQALSIVEMFDDEEIRGLEFISHIMQESYTFCKKKADEQILTLTHASPLVHSYKEETTDSQNESPKLSQILKDTEIAELYLLRWKFAMLEPLRDQIRKEFETVAMKEIDEGIKVKFPESLPKTILMKFICDCADISWLIATCHPPLKMRFDVKDEMYEGWIREWFKKYTTKKNVAMNSYPKGFIVCVAWPALVSADESLLHQKGEVITID